LPYPACASRAGSLTRVAVALGGSPTLARSATVRKEIRLATDDSVRELEQLRAEVGELREQRQAAQAQAQAARAQIVAAKAETRSAKAQAARAVREASVPADGAGQSAGQTVVRTRRSWRAPVAAVLIVLGCTLAPVSVLAVWSANQISDTSRYVANVAPLITEPAVQGALTDKITTAITSEINVQGIADQAAKQLSSRGLTRLSALIAGFSGTLASGVNSFIHSSVAKIISNPLVARLWVQANRAAHTQLVKALSGQTNGAISISGGKVVIGLGPFIDQVEHNLSARGLTLVSKLPAINPTFPLFSAKYLIQAQSAYRLLTTLKWALPLLAILLMAAGTYVARRHRRALVGVGLGLAGSMLLLGIGLAVARVIYLNKVPPTVLPADAAAAVFDTVVRFIKQGLRVLLVLGLVVALAGFFTGPSISAVRTRNAFRSAFGTIRGTGERAGVSTGPVGTWIYRYRMSLRIAAVTIAALAFVFWSEPTGLVVLGIAIATAVVLGLIELIGRPPTDAAGTRASTALPR
jgi:hypothetical protein